jgi:hypothetical protein
MGTSNIADYNNPVIAALTIGLSCGTACSPLANLFLTSYTMSGFIGFRRGLGAFSCFVLGKTTVMMILTVFSAILGSVVLGENSKVFGFNRKLILDICLILTGVVLLLIQDCGPKSRSGCRGCAKSCRQLGGVPPEKAAKLPIVIMGAAYALTPCAPMVIILGYASMLAPLPALRLGLIFSIASSVSPLLIITALAGFFSRKMHLEIPQLMRSFQRNVFMFYIITGGIALLLHW